MFLVPSTRFLALDWFISGTKSLFPLRIKFFLVHFHYFYSVLIVCNRFQIVYDWIDCRLFMIMFQSFWQFLKVIKLFLVDFWTFMIDMTFSTVIWSFFLQLLLAWSFLGTETNVLTSYWKKVFWSFLIVFHCFMAGFWLFLTVFDGYDYFDRFPLI